MEGVELPFLIYQSSLELGLVFSLALASLKGKKQGGNKKGCTSALHQGAILRFLI